MTEYISREAAMEIVKRTSGDYAAAWSEIRKLPAAKVVEDRHGRWSYDGQCSECGGFDDFDPLDPFGSKYCPHCGARMDGRC